jgi:hypothetical protein
MIETYFLSSISATFLLSLSLNFAHRKIRAVYKKIWRLDFYESILAEGDLLSISPSRISRWRVVGWRGYPLPGRACIIPWIHNPDANSRHACLDLNGRDISRIRTRIFALFFTVSPRNAARVTASSFRDVNPLRSHIISEALETLYELL